MKQKMAMPTIEQIEDFGRRIGETFRPRQVVLFGSYARGAATADSDVDVLVVIPFKGRSVDKSVEIRLKTNPPFPLDLLVRTPEVVRQRIEMGDYFLRDILRDGKVLYAAHDG
jgi:predicted nucleotidyltransferase